MGEARRMLFPVTDAADRHRMSSLFAAVRGGLLNEAGDPVLIHADLAACHLLWDGTEPRLSGVIDFGCAGLGDPALDVAALIEAYGDGFLTPLSAELPVAYQLIERARAYAALSLVQRQIDEVSRRG